MDEDMLDCIRALAENRIQDAKDKVIHYADESHTQAEIIKFLIEQIVKK